MIGLVLAGGQSRRFGVDKATYALPGHPANVVSAVKRLLPLCEQVIVVANPANQRQIQALVGDRATVILDPEPFLGEGPVAGILARLPKRGQGAFALPLRLPKPDHPINAGVSWATNALFTSSRQEPLHLGPLSNRSRNGTSLVIWRSAALARLLKRGVTLSTTGN